MKLILGSWTRDYGDEYTHVDLAKLPNVDIVSNVNKLPLEDNVAEYMFASHVLEYFDRQEGLNVLKEWYRVLKPQGTIRIAVPDFKAMAELYYLNDKPLDNLLGPLFGRMECNGETIYHKTTYDLKGLHKAMTAAGFKGIRTYNWRDTPHAHIDDHSQAYIPHMDKKYGTLISLNVEATK
jgi:ubiquinone/menaquinone biosynthesis C-methylase UbiE